jgi:LexA-binding, inner membrane-associated putative hydrolase
MFIFGHLGFGWKIAQPVSQKRYSVPWILLGTLLPDLIDKPIYYGSSWLTGKNGAELGIFAGTRTIGHTGLFLCLLIFLAYRFKDGKARVALQSLCIGVSTHLLLDNLGDALRLMSSDNLRVFAWPLSGFQFPSYPYTGVKNHLSILTEPYFFITEGLGAAILLWEGMKFRRSSAVSLKRPKEGQSKAVSN